MFIIHLLLIFTLNSMVIAKSLIVDETCYEASAKTILSDISDEGYNEEISHFESSPFATVVRHCLGEDGNVNSNDFVQCVIGYNSCGTTWYSSINWEFCLCNTIYCILKNCLQYWAETSDFGNLSCLAPCLSQSHTCFTRQIGE